MKKTIQPTVKQKQERFTSDKKSVLQLLVQHLHDIVMHMDTQYKLAGNANYTNTLIQYSSTVQAWV